jgi:sporulation protein YlmC with PRC-barrel domain
MKTTSRRTVKARVPRRTWCTTIACLAATAPAIAMAATTEAPRPAQQCLTDLKALDSVQQKDGYWLDGGGYGYGYPVYGYGYRYGSHDAESNRYQRGRPGYEVRTMIAAARILGQKGEQVACENVLSAARDAYTEYVAELRKGQVPPASASTWRREQIETAVPVTGENLVYRSDELIGASIVNGRDDTLGSVEDIIMSPQTGKIAYLVVSHGGLWGIDATYTPVPWSDFKSAVTTNLLVLQVQKSTLDAAPQYSEDKIGRPGEFATQSQAVDSYWSAHPPVAMK